MVNHSATRLPSALLIEMDVALINSPLGTIHLEASAIGITKLIFTEEQPEKASNNAHILKCIDQLAAYFEGSRKSFNIPLDMDGTDFQKKVWHQLQNIPFGKTISYLDLAKQLGNPKSIRAAAHANGQNTVSIIVPCHRVIGSDGSLTGYAGGLWRKQWLLEHEMQGKQQRLF
ncbi:MAG: methylated-DNA--[protein]-cysteine S-methyltransferase [Bacteroidales bacterium]|nr:methylated-DNA--[protein]-cysteine S-methyltransferase [Bacteroidales bacterium]